MAKKDEGWLWLLVLGAFVLIGVGSGAAIIGTSAGAAIMATGRLTATQIKQFAANAGFVGQDLITAVAVALAESFGGDPNAHGDLTLGSGTGSFGLWQIYSDAHPEYGPDFTKLFDPQTNADAAYAIYLAAGPSFMPWTTYKSGAYKAFVPEATNA